MEAIRDADQHMLCAADPYTGVLEHRNRRETIRICLPVGGEVVFFREKTCTVIRRQGQCSLYVNSIHVDNSC